ncbi:MAG: hypothetical protein ACHQIH_03880 [Ignavibacteria bacterium]
MLNKIVIADDSEFGDKKPGKPYDKKISSKDYRYYMERCKEIEAMHYFEEFMDYDRVYDVLNENVLNCRN